MNKKGLLLVISGPSGVGKGTICELYKKAHDNCFISVSMTTRSPRPGEVEGINYYYVSDDTFNKRISEDGFLEHARFCDHQYGTPKDKVLEMIDSGKDVILEIEVQGAMQVRQHYPQAVFIFVLPPTFSELEHRLRGRKTENEDVISDRLNRSKKEFMFIEKYNYTLLNDSVDEAVKKLESIVDAEKCRIERNYEYIKKEFID